MKSDIFSLWNVLPAKLNEFWDTSDAVDAWMQSFNQNFVFV